MGLRVEVGAASQRPRPRSPRLLGCKSRLRVGLRGARSARPGAGAAGVGWWPAERSGRFRCFRGLSVSCLRSPRLSAASSGFTASSTRRRARGQARVAGAACGAGRWALRCCVRRSPPPSFTLAHFFAPDTEPCPTTSASRICWSWACPSRWPPVWTAS